VVAVPENIIAETGTAPAYQRCDNGPEFAFIYRDLLGRTASSNRSMPQFRSEKLSGEIMDTMAEAAYLAEEWKAIYNHERPPDP
jgi:putative transposase